MSREPSSPWAASLTEQSCDPGADLAGDLLGRKRRIQHEEALGLGCRERKVLGAHPLMEFVAFRAVAGSRSSSTVSSGSNPSVAHSDRSRISSRPSTRPAPWYATDESR